MERVLITGLLALLVASAAGCSPEEGTPCPEACNRALACARKQARSAGLQWVEEKDSLVSDCVAACGGEWQRANALGERLAFECPVPGGPSSSLGGLLAPAGRAHPGISRVAEPLCRALAGEESACGELVGDAQADCRRSAAVRQAVATHDPAACGTLSGAWGAFCRAMATGDPCPDLPAPLGPLCRQVRAARADSDPAHLLLAVGRGDPRRCVAVTDSLERARCRAATTGSARECPVELRVASAWASAVGDTLARGDEGPPDAPLAPGWLPGLYALLQALAVALLVVLTAYPIVTCARLVRPRGPGAFGFVALLLVAALVRWFVVVEGPVNFVAYERIFVPGEDDLGRLSYAGFALLLKPLMALFGPSFDLVFLVNGWLGAVSLTALFSIGRRVHAEGSRALSAVALLGLAPLFLRISGSAAETMAFTALSLVAVDLLLGWAERPRMATVLLIIVVPVLSVCRPEGLLAPLLLVPALWLGMRGQSLRRVPFWTLVGGLVPWFGLLAWLQTRHELPPVHGGLLIENGRDFLADLVSPALFSVAIPVAALAGTWRLWREGNRTGLVLGIGSLLWTSALLVVWSIQGPEDNLVFGSSRYLVMALPWWGLLAAALGPKTDQMAPQHFLRPANGLVLVLLATMAPQCPMLWARTNMQQEYEGLAQAVTELTAGTRVALFVGPEENPEYAPENGPLALLSLADRDLRWVSARALSRGTESADFLLLGIYRETATWEAVRQRCTLEPVRVQRVVGMPDVAWYRQLRSGQEQEVGLYRITRCAQ